MKPEDGKKIYDRIEIPEELEETVRRSIEEAGRRREARLKKEEETEKKIRKPRRLFRQAAAAAAGIFFVFVLGLNTNQAFAETMKRIPGLGALAEVFTVRSYHESDGDYQINAKIPQIVQSEEETSGHSSEADRVNEEIERMTDTYMEEAKKEFEEYKENFFARGGTEEEWNNRQMDISVDYEVKYQDEKILSLELTVFKGWINALEERHYYNLDLAKDRELSLRDVLGDDYAEQCNREVKRQIGERMAADENQIFFGFGESGDLTEGFTTVDETTDFYINEKGEVVLVFPEYSIAPGYMGIIEFTVGKAMGTADAG